jgi:hypothetical protein
MQTYIEDILHVEIQMLNRIYVQHISRCGRRSPQKTEMMDNIAISSKP